jgi:hypothetical protein
MTTKMKVIFVMAASVFVAFPILMSTQFAVDIAHRALSVVANALDLHEAPALSALAVLVIPGLYLAFRQRRQP